ncbi:MAG: hypothetical protein WC107_04930 [Patescibacteria group bacterium]
MNCPRCGGKMVEEKKFSCKKEADGSGTLNGTHQVWFCRDCHATAPIK